MTSAEFKLPFWVSNGGDGSANVRFCSSPEEAEAADEEQDEGWGECSADFVLLRVIDGELFFRDYRPDSNGNYNYVWIAVKQE